jgi:hypothetical protein
VGKHPIPSSANRPSVRFVPRYLAEWYRPDPSDQRFRRAYANVVATAIGTPVQLLLTVLVPADDVAFGLFTAPSAAGVEQVCRAAGYPPTRVAEAVAEFTDPPSTRRSS